MNQQEKQYCVLFLRVSTEKQEEEGLSLEAQEDYLRSYADRENLEVLKVFSAGESAKPAIRKKFQKMLEYMKANDSVDTLLVEKQDRFSREPRKDFIYDLQDTCKNYNIQEIHFPKNGSVFNEDKKWEAGQKMTSRVQHSIDIYKSENISDEVLKAIKVRLEKGIPIKASIGYKWQGEKKKKTLVKTEQWQKVKSLLDLYSKYKYSLSRMLKESKRLGLRGTKNNQPYSRKEDIRKIFMNRLYYGQFEYKGAIQDMHGIYDVKLDGFEPMITKKQFEKNQKTLASKQNYELKSHDKKKQFLFSGICRCAKCNGLFYGVEYTVNSQWEIKKGKDKGKKVSKPYNYLDYTHMRNYHLDADGNKVKCDVTQFKEDEILAEVEDSLGLLQWDQERWLELKQRLFKDENKDLVHAELKSRRTEKTINENRIDKLLDAYADEIMSAEVVNPKIEKLKKRQGEVDEEILDLEELVENYQDKFSKQIQILDSMKDFHKIWKNKNLSKQKKVDYLKHLTMKVELSSKKVYKKEGGRNKRRIYKAVNIIWNEEFNELFEAGLMKRVEEFEAPKIPNPNKENNASVQFNCKTFRDG